MREFSALVLGTWALLALMIASNAPRRASQPNPINGPVRVLSEVAR